MRSLPKAKLSPLNPNYAPLAATGWDTIQEALDLMLSPVFVELLTGAQEAAKARADNLDAVEVIELADERLKVHATGAKGGFRWRLECDDYLLLIGSPKREWTVSVRYTSAGLWEHGVTALRERVFNALRSYTVMRSPDCIRITRADWCFDFYSPAFTREFGPGLVAQTVCHSSTKSRERGSYDVHGRAGIGETLTVGTKAGLEVQVYDKVREITEQSGKTWLFDLWAKNLGDAPWGNGKPADLWRLECRFSKAFLKERNIRRPHELEAVRDKLIAEALFTRRLTVASASDANHWRWPLHPLWSAAYRVRGAGEMLPLGRKVTGRREVMTARMRKQIAGSIRSAIVLEHGAYDGAKALELVTQAHEAVTHDPKHQDKVSAAQDRYSDVEDAR